MDIYPNDISPQIRTQILCAQRFLGGDPIGAMLSGTQKNEAEQITLLAGGWGCIFGAWAELALRHMQSVLDLALFGICGGIVGAGIGYFGKKASVRRWNMAAARSKITEFEIMFATEKETDSLKQDYLGVISTLISLPQPQEKATAQSIKNTLRLLGEAIEGLPVPPAEDLLLDPHVLTDEAQTLATKAEDESDAIIRASLHRQASALTRQAETITHTAALVRRNQALRTEVGTQVRAFQTSLAAGQIKGIQDTDDLATLADHVALIAQETNALADARLELDTALAIPSSIPETRPPQTMRVGRN
jgi:hypothetical protein